MKHILGATKRTVTGSVAALFLLATVFVALPPQTASAAGLLNRSLTLTSAQPSDYDNTGSGEEANDPGDASNGDQVGHTYGFQVKTGGNVQSLKLQYCHGPFGYLEYDDGTGDCAMTDIAGFSAAGADQGAYVSVWTNFAAYQAAPTTPNTAVDEILFAPANAGASTTQEILISAASAQAFPANSYVIVEFRATASNFFVNPTSAANKDTFFAHIETYTGDGTAAAATEAEVDEGTVASSTSETIAINTRVAESLKFSVTATETALGVPAETAACAPLTGTGVINMGDSTNDYALDSQRSYDAYSYFRLATNSANGAKVLYAGETLKSTAGDEIDAMSDAGEASVKGTAQFGLGIAVAATGANEATGGSYTANDIQVDTTGGNALTYEAAYGLGAEGFDGTDNANGSYAFDETSNGVPVPIATSLDVVSCDTGVVRYIANISPETPAGLYSTKISYIAAPAF
jgi:hypothetical protein